MKALVYHGPHDFRLEERPKPKVGPGDVLVKVLLSTICGTELHMLHGSHDARDGVILGHEVVGLIDQVGEGVRGFEVGDRVAVSCITRCGQCYYCLKGLYSHCERGGGWVMGYQMDGSHAEFVRVPYAELGTYKIPQHVKNEEVILVGDALSTGYMHAKMAQIQPGDVVVVYGSGPIGISTMASARLWSPKAVVAVDRIQQRLDVAREMVADVAINAGEADPVEAVRKMTGGRGADVTIEAVGSPATLLYALNSVRKGGHVGVVGVFSEQVPFPMERLWEMNIQLTTGLLDTADVPQLIDLIASGRINLGKLLTHTFPLDRAHEAFEVFDKKKDGAMKVGLIP